MIRLFFLVGMIASITGFGQQCPTVVDQLLPPLHPALFGAYGNTVDVDGDYLVVSDVADHSAEYFAGALFVYKADAGGQWQKIAKLIPSVGEDASQLGVKVSIHGDVIVAIGNSYDAAGDSHTIVYVFEKDPASEWTSGSESYKINVEGARNNCYDLEFDGTDLVVSVGTIAGNKVKVYRKVGAQFSFVAQLLNPNPGSIGDDAYGTNLALENGTLAVSAPNFDEGNLFESGGLIFLYEYSGGWPATPVATIRATPSGIPFVGNSPGTSIALSQNTLISIGYNGGLPALCVHEKPPAGWADASISPLLTINPAYNAFLRVCGDYIFFQGDNSSIRILKRSLSSWTSVFNVKTLDNPLGKDFLFGSGLAGDDNHVIFGAPPSVLEPGGTGKVASYYSATKDWSNIVSPSQALTELSFNDTRDYFGGTVDSNTEYTVVGSPGDFERGWFAGAAYVFKRNGSSWSAPVKFTAPDAAKFELFGTAVGIGDSVMFISATGSSAGKVYVYRLMPSGWTYDSQLLAPDGKNYFGQFIAWTKGQVAISAFATNTSEDFGFVYIFQEKAGHRWEYLATLRPSVPQRGDLFGRNISMNDSTIVIATGNVEYQSDYKMKVHVFTRKGSWKNATEDARLLPTGKNLYDRFGASVSLYGKIIVVGSPGYPGYPVNPGNSDFDKGIAYIFERPEAGWIGTINEVSRLLPSDPVKENMFGYSVAISADDIFIGAPNGALLHDNTDHQTNGQVNYRNGKVYHYIKPPNGAWQSSSQEFRQLFSTDPEPIDGFGQRIFISNRHLFVGTPFDDTSVGFKTGSVFIFSLDPIVEDLVKPRCIEDGPVHLVGLPVGGTWAGAGFHNPASGIFDPSGLVPGDYQVTYTSAGCQAFNSVSVISSGFQLGTVSPSEQTRCTYDAATIAVASNAEAKRYEWYYKTKSTDPYQLLSNGTMSITVNKDGYYMSKIKHPVCFSHVEQFSVTSEGATLAIAQPPFVCDDKSFLVTASPAGGIWKGNGVSPSGTFSPSSQPDGTIKLTYTYTTPIGCLFSKDVDVVINKIPKSLIQASTHILCSGDQVTLSLMPIKSDTEVRWFDTQPAEGLSLTQSLTVKEAGEYYAILTHHGCQTETPAYKVFVQQDSVFVPNVFTPNGDSFNDAFTIIKKSITDFRLNIVDRNGTEYFTSVDPDFKWTGQNAPEGIYYWSINFRNCGGEDKNLKGWVQLVR